MRASLGPKEQLQSLGPKEQLHTTNSLSPLMLEVVSVPFGVGFAQLRLICVCACLKQGMLCLGNIPTGSFR